MKKSTNLFTLPKKVTFFMLFFLLSLPGLAQKVTLPNQTVTIKQVMSQIEKQTGYKFFYNNTQVDLNRSVTIKAKNKPLPQVLELLFKGTNISYKLMDRNIVLSNNDSSVEHPKSTGKRLRQIKGVIVDSNGEPIIGATIKEVGTSTGTISNVDGEFTLNSSQSTPDLEISSLGYLTQKVKANVDNLHITLKDDTKSLNEVVVIGFGSQKKGDLTGAVSAVSGKDISRRPVANSAALLQSQIPGLSVTQSVGQPGSEDVTLRVRGQGTFSSAGSDPLVLINGVPGNMSSLDPSVIESVSVLKDAASAAIYGARAANGVILITTKSGSFNQKAHISYHGNVGFHSATKLWDLVTNSAEYMELFNTASQNSGLSYSYPEDQIELYRQNNGKNPEYPNFDWIDYMFNTATVQTHNLTAYGGGESASYNISLNYVDQPGILRGYNYKKYNFSSDLQAKINKHIKIGSYSNMMYSKRREPILGEEDVILSTFSQAPTYMPWLWNDPTKYTSKAYTWEQNNKNPVAVQGSDQFNLSYTYDVNTQLWAEVNFLNDFSWYTKGAARLLQVKSEEWHGGNVPLYNYHTGDYMNAVGHGSDGFWDDDYRTFYLNFYTYLKYEHTFARAHHITAMGGYNMEHQKYETIGGYRRTYSFPLHTLNAGATDNWSNNGGRQDWAIMSFFGRLNYDYRSRYLFSANFRYDGTSRISKHNRWGFFPSFSGGWRVTEEPFVKNMNLSWLDNLKIRASWGKLGNQNIGVYPYQSVIPSGYDYSFNKVDQISGYAQAAYANSNIKWESTTVTDIGIDLTVLRGLNLTFDWYNKQTDDILRSSQVAATLGMSAPTVNYGGVRNRGYEVSLKWEDVAKSSYLRGMHYSAGVYFTHNNNKLTKFGAEEISGRYLYREGLPYQSYYMLKCIGIFADQAEIDASPKQYNDNTQPGDLKYEDVNGDNVINDKDRVVIKGRYPSLEYAINLSAEWKGFDFSAIGSGIVGQKFYMTEWGVYPFRQGSAPTKEYVAGMWTEDNPYHATYPRIYFDNFGGSKNTRSNSWFLQSGTYFRLKNITLGYTLPRDITGKAGLNKVRFYFSGENLFTITPFKGIDPERYATSSRSTEYPQNKIYSFGINVEF